MTGDGDEEEVRLIGVLRAEATLSDVLEEIALTGVLSGELPRRLVEGFGIPIGVYINLEILLHLVIVELEDARRVVGVGKDFRHMSLLRRDGEVGNLGWRGGVFEREVGEGEKSEDREEEERGAQREEAGLLLPLLRGRHHP